VWGEANKGVARAVLRGRNRLLGLDRYAGPERYFGPGGLEATAAVCSEAGRDLPAWILPPATVPGLALRAEPVPRTTTGRLTIAEWSFASPRPSGVAVNDRVWLRLLRPRHARDGGGKVVLFHHPVYTRRWALWQWFLEPLAERVPLAMMAGPWHLRRTPTGWFPGEGTVNPNPARLYEAFRQWAWDRQAAVAVLREAGGLGLAAELGFSLGAFQTLLLAAGGGVDVPIVAVSATNRYVWGLENGIIGRGLLRSMAAAGVDRARLAAWCDAVQLERYVACLRGAPVLSIRGSRDRVDPPPSLERLERALAPARAVVLPAGHGSILLWRRRILREAIDFLASHGVVPLAPPRTPAGDRPTPLEA